MSIRILPLQPPWVLARHNNRFTSFWRTCPWRVKGGDLPWRVAVVAWHPGNVSSSTCPSRERGRQPLMQRPPNAGPQMLLLLLMMIIRQRSHGKSTNWICKKTIKCILNNVFSMFWCVFSVRELAPPSKTKRLTAIGYDKYRVYILGPIVNSLS